MFQLLTFNRSIFGRERVLANDDKGDSWLVRFHPAYHVLTETPRDKIMKKAEICTDDNGNVYIIPGQMTREEAKVFFPDRPNEGIDVTEEIGNGDLNNIIQILTRYLETGFDRLCWDGYNSSIHLYKSERV